MTDTKYIRKNRDFLVWDGEGKNFPDGSHRLVLLANSDGDFLYDDNGLSTIQCFKLLLRPRENKINVWYSFGYDINKILCDVPFRRIDKKDFSNLETLHKFGMIYYKGFRIRYIPRKVFTLKGDNLLFTSTDTFSFFQTSFLKACENWHVSVPDIVKEGKANRNIFDTYTSNQIIDYNLVELQCAKQLIERLREAFEIADLKVTSWHGPGALANAFFRKHNIQEHYGIHPEEMEQPIKHAYFGGRIDVGYVGETEAFGYDITSAYPDALSKCISLKDMFWSYSPYASIDVPHALYHVKWDIPYSVQWGPFPWRKENGTVLFPNSGEGWYWGIEVIAAQKLFGRKYIKRLGVWFPMSKLSFPFYTPIRKAFEERKKVGKSTGPGVAIKLVLNSLYGKLCQQVGIHKWQNFIWAGYITAHTRAKMLDLIRRVGEDNVIAIATDGIYTKEPVSIKGTGLGGWEYQGKSTMLIVGAGLYTIFKNGTPTLVKQRGLPSNINHGYILRKWGCTTELNSLGDNSETSTFITFIAMGKALHQNKPWGVFIEETRTLQDVMMGGTSKRLPRITLWDKPWLLLPLDVRQRKIDGPLLSTPFKRNKQITLEKRIEDEASEIST